MRNLLALVGLLVVGFGGIGWYCGWYKMTVSRTPEGNLQVNTNVDMNKAGQDTSSFIKKVGEAIGERAEKAGQPGAAPVNTPGPVQPPAKEPEKPAGIQGSWLLSPATAGPAATTTPPNGTPIKLVAPRP